MKTKIRVIQIWAVAMMIMIGPLVSVVSVQAAYSNNSYPSHNWGRHGPWSIRNGNIPNPNPPMAIPHYQDGNYNGVPQTNIVVTQNGSFLWGHDINGQWIMLTSDFSRDLKISGDRIGMVNVSNQIATKNGMYGQWQVMPWMPFDEYQLSQSLLVIRIGQCIYYAANGQWVLLVSNFGSGLTVDENRVIYTPLL